MNVEWWMLNVEWRLTDKAVFVKTEPESENSVSGVPRKWWEKSLTVEVWKVDVRKIVRNFCAEFVRAEFGIVKNSLKVQNIRWS